MTIAACYVSDEGVVFGADSTTTYSTAPSGTARHLNNAQKIFEIGEMGSTLGLVTWGLGGFPTISYRQMVAELSDDLLENPPSSVQEVADRWLYMAWHRYSTLLAAPIADFQALKAKSPSSPNEHMELLRQYGNLFVGFCIGGHVERNRRPEAYGVLLGPDLTVPLPAFELARYRPLFWGVPNLIQRLLYGIDEQIFARIAASPLWTGNEDQLQDLVDPNVLSMPVQVPLRDAVDWIYSSIFVTIKAQYCPVKRFQF